MFLALLMYGWTTATALYVLYKWATLNNEYFVKREIPYLRPTFLVGNFVGLYMNRHNPMDFLISIYNKFPDAK